MPTEYVFFYDHADSAKEYLYTPNLLGSYQEWNHTDLADR